MQLLRTTGLVLLGALTACEGRFGAERPGEPTTAVTPPARPPRVVPAGAAQLRLLSASEYRRSVEAAVGLAPSATLDHADWSAGFDSGAGGQLHDNLFGVLLAETEGLATRAVAGPLRAELPCLAAASPGDDCLGELASRLGRRAWRRPLTTAQRDELVAGARRAAEAGGSAVAGVEALVARVLLAPQFLYRAELGRPSAGNPRARALDAFERASLVAFAVTGGPPDEALLDAAERGELDDAGLRAQVRRLWATPAARARFAEVLRQWLKATALDDMVRRPQDFPKLASPALGVALRDEFDAYVAAVAFDGAGTLTSLLSETSAPAKPETAPLYGLPAPAPGVARMALDPRERAGILTLASTMAALASAGDASKDRPVLRGLVLKEQLLCEPVGAPSAVNTVAAGSAAATVPDFERLTTREQYEKMMEQGASCAACHAQFMPLGFAFGRYDALGRYRTTQRERPVDVTVRGMPLLGEPRSFADGLEATRFLAAHEAVAACFTRHYLAYVTGVARTPSTDELAGALDDVRDGAPLRFSQLAEAALSDARLYARVATVEPVLSAPSPAPDAGTPPSAAEVLLASGIELRPGDARTSPSGGFTLRYQLDGNLVLSRADGQPTWASGTAGRTPRLAAMQGDGNLVVYDADGPAWNSGTAGSPGAHLAVDGAGRPSVRATTGATLWTPPGGTP